jgi:hypothetical protein
MDENSPAITGGLRAAFRSPKTILGFFAALVAILAFATYGITKTLASNPQYQYLVPYVLGFAAGCFVFIAVAILVTAWFAPEKLMLGEITGAAYADLVRLKQGDSKVGEFVTTVRTRSTRRLREPKLIEDDRINKLPE